MPLYNNPIQLTANYGYQPQPFSGAVPDQMTQLRQPYIPPMYAQPAVNPQSPAQDTGIIWVQGEAGAKAYMVAPGNTVVLWDSESNTIYIKSADMAGMPTTRILDWQERPASSGNIKQNQINQYVTRDEFDALAARIDTMTTPVNGINKTEGNNAE